jgi:hypothetical protein
VFSPANTENPAFGVLIHPISIGPVAYQNPSCHMAMDPTKQNMLIKDVIRHYQASDSTSAVTQFLVH